MGEKMYKFLLFLIFLAAAVAVFFGIRHQNYVLPTLAVITAVFASIILKKNFSEVITEDERLKLLSMRASRFSYIVFNISAAATGNILIILGKNGPSLYTAVGYTLAFSVCVMLTIDVIMYAWLKKVG